MAERCDAPGVKAHATRAEAREGVWASTWRRWPGPDQAAGSRPRTFVTQRPGARGTAEPAAPVADVAGSTRRAIADNLERQAAIPQVTDFRTVDCTALEARRGELGISPLPLVIAALTRTVAEHPALNARWHDGDVEDRGGDQRRRRHRHRTRVSGRRAARSRERRHRRALARRSSALPTAPGRDRSTPGRDARARPIAVSNTGSYGSEAGTPILSPGTSHHPRDRRDRAESARRGRRGRCPARVHPELHVRPPGARRRHRGARPHRPGAAAWRTSRAWETCRA